MQKRLKSLLIVASLVITASLIFNACGDGAIRSLEEVRSDVDASDIVLGAKIKSDDPAIWTGPPLEEPSSSSEEPTPPPPPSSEAEPESSASPPPVSSEAPTKSSSSSASKTSSSSSTAAVKSSSSKAVSTGGSCGENNPKSGFTCGWDGYSATAILAPGNILKPAKATIPSGCTVEWNYAQDTSNIALTYFCDPIDESGAPAEGSMNYVLFATLTCSDGKHVNACNPKNGWSSKRAPELKGECKWNRDQPVTTSAKGAIPSGVTISDPDKVCSSPTVDYTYADGTKKWDVKTGILSEWGSGVWKTDKKHKETYSDVTPTLNCPAYATTVKLPECPALEVSAGADHQITCKGDQLGQCTKVKPVKDDECIDIELDWTGSHASDKSPIDAKIACQVSGSSNGKVTIKVNGKETSGEYYLPVHLVNITAVGKIEITGVCVKLPGGGTAECGLTQ